MIIEKYTLKNTDQLPEIAKKILAFAGEIKVILFEGQMGAGKTTLIKSICGELGVVEETSSPTFAIINPYQSKMHGPVYHFDCYRLKNEKEAYEAGCEEYFFSGNYCLIEWPEIIYNLLPDSYVKVQVVAEPDESRNITLSKTSGKCSIF